MYKYYLFHHKYLYLLLVALFEAQTNYYLFWMRMQLE